MANSVPFRDVLRQIHTRLSTWEEAVDRAKSPRSRYIATIGWKGMAALLQYNISLRTARLGTSLLKCSLDNRREGLLFGLTKRPMFESYTRGMWLEFVADEDFAESFLSRSPGDVKRDWTTLASKRNSPGLTKMWSDLSKRKIMEDTVRWMKGKKDPDCVSSSACDGRPQENEVQTATQPRFRPPERRFAVSGEPSRSTAYPVRSSPEFGTQSGEGLVERFHAHCGEERVDGMVQRVRRRDSQ